MYVAVIVSVHFTMVCRYSRQRNSSHHHASECVRPARKSCTARRTFAVISESSRLQSRQSVYFVKQDASTTLASRWATHCWKAKYVLCRFVRAISKSLQAIVLDYLKSNATTADAHSRLVQRLATRISSQRREAAALRAQAAREEADRMERAAQQLRARNQADDDDDDVEDK